MAEHKDIPVADLKLDILNPRHQPASGQREAIEALLEEGGEKLIKLAEDIAANGLSPIDEPLVIRNPGKASYTVVEGNRRMAALKLLINPDLAKDKPAYQKRFKGLSKGSSKVPFDVHCFVIDTREEAKHWMELRHGGERGGAGVVPWGTEAAHRFAGRKGSHTDRGIMFIEALERTYPSNKALQGDLAIIRKSRLTTLGRLVSDPAFRDRFGFEFEGGEVYGHYSATDLEQPINRVANDLAHRLTVSELKTKDQRRRYVDKVGKELNAEYQAEAVLLTSKSSGRRAKPTTRKMPETKSDSRSTKSLFYDVELANLGDKVSSLLREIKQLDPNRFPNACAALTRVLLELAVGQVFELKGWTRKSKLKDEVKFCLTRVDPSGNARRFQSVRSGLQDGTSMMAVATIQGFMHNPDFHPTGAEVRRIASNWAPFIKALDALV